MKYKSQKKRRNDRNKKKSGKMQNKILKKKMMEPVVQDLFTPEGILVSSPLNLGISFSSEVN